jgi:hypothetical protein
VAVALVGTVSVLTLPLALPAPLPVKYAHAMPATSKPPKAKAAKVRKREARVMSPLGRAGRSRARGRNLDRFAASHHQVAV